jgi:hypothetical protein
MTKLDAMGREAARHLRRLIESGPGAVPGVLGPTLVESGWVTYVDGGPEVEITDAGREWFGAVRGPLGVPKEKPVNRIGAEHARVLVAIEVGDPVRNALRTPLITGGWLDETGELTAEGRAVIDVPPPEDKPWWPHEYPVADLLDALARVVRGARHELRKVSGQMVRNLVSRRWVVVEPGAPRERTSLRARPTPRGLAVYRELCLPADSPAHLPPRSPK